MTRARHAFAATLVAASFLASTALAQAAQTPPPMTSVLAGKKFTPPIRGQADVEFVKKAPKREKEMVVTVFTVKNLSSAPIPRLTIDETWYDKGGQIVGGGKGVINGLLQPGEIKTITIETPFNAKMASNNYVFSHANGQVKPHAVKSLEDPNAKPATKPPAAKKKSEK